MKKNIQQVTRMAQIRNQKLQLMQNLEVAKKLDPVKKRKLLSMKGMRW